MSNRSHAHDLAPLRPLPLCVDLDGTLIRTDVLVETLLIACRGWRTLRLLPVLLFAGKAVLKQRLAQLCPINCAFLPYNDELIAFLQEQKRGGRLLVLVTAADRRVATQVNAHLGHLFDEVIGSDGARNLRGAEKAQALVERFGERGFTYVGNDRTDLAVWSHAASAVVVAAPASVVRRATHVARVERVFARHASLFRATLREIRPLQWLKNLLVFVPIITSGDFLNLAAWSSALVTFAAFCAVASAVYIVNDLFDLEADRRHPRKFARPFASGAMPLTAGLVLAPLLFALGFFLARTAEVLPYLLGYAAMSIAYSVRLKEKPLVDVFMLAALYSIRLFTGGIAVEREVSLWLLAFSCFMFLGLAVMKRVTELSAMEKQGRPDPGRRGYIPSDLVILLAFGTNASFVSSMVLALYVRSDAAALGIGNQHLVWMIVPLMLFWQCRLWFATARGRMTDDPIVFTARDWVSALVALGLVATMVLGHILP